MTTYGEIESAAWDAVALAKSLAIEIEDRQKRLSTLECVEGLENRLLRLAP